jgi:ribosome-associated toxin RatA of RatAB toxin-antitoxin module
MGGLFDKAVRKYTDAFEARADKIYGRAFEVAKR